MNDKTREAFEQYDLVESEPTNINEISLMLGELKDAVSEEFFKAGYTSGFNSQNPEIEKLFSRVAVAEGKVIEQDAEIKELRHALKQLMHGVERLPPLTAIQGALTAQWKIAEKALKGGEG